MTGSKSAAGRVFISYRREEAGYTAGWLFDKLVEHLGKGQVFKDVDSIQLGDDFAEVIRDAVASCEVLLALVGMRWLTITGEDGQRRLDDPHDFVRLEIETALARNIRVIPVLVDGAQMPRKEELPPSLAKLVRRQALELSWSRFGADLGRLLRVLDGGLAGAQDPHAGTQPRSPSQPRQPDRTGALKNVAELESKLAAVVSVIVDNARTLDASSEDVHKIVEDLRRALKQEAFVPGGLLDPSIYRETYNSFEVTYAAENDMYEAYVDALERYERRRVRDLSVAESDSDRLALVERRREYIPTLLEFQEQVKAILDYLAERSSSP
jgi:hypothetical protein